MRPVGARTRLTLGGTICRPLAGPVIIEQSDRLRKRGKVKKSQETAPDSFSFSTAETPKLETFRCICAIPHRIWEHAAQPVTHSSF
jgi:hypothetical protein